MHPPCFSRAWGFSLIELTIVIAILGILGAIAVPMISNAQDQSAINATAQSLNQLSTAVEVYHHDTDTWPADASQGVTPEELRPYLVNESFEGTPLGGVWDYGYWPSSSTTAGGDEVLVGVSAADVDTRFHEPVDAVADDGNLATGPIRTTDSSPSLIRIVRFK